MHKFISWRLFFLICILPCAAFFSAAQAITYAWLSSFPEQASKLEYLNFKFWTFAAFSCVILAIELLFIFRFIRDILMKKRL
jgi:hypothetical protein